MLQKNKDANYNSMTSFDEYVDSILSALKDGSRKHIYGVIDYHVPEMAKKDDRVILVDYLKRKDLVTECRDNEWEVKITPFGYDIHNSGGWIKYLEGLEKSKEDAIKRDANRFRVASILSVFALVISCIPIGYDIFSDGKINALRKELDKQSHKTDSLLKVTNSRIDLLKTSQKRDSLPN